MHRSAACLPSFWDSSYLLALPKLPGDKGGPNPHAHPHYLYIAWVVKALNWRGRRRGGDLTGFVAEVKVFIKDVLFSNLPPFARSAKENSNETAEYDNHGSQQKGSIELVGEVEVGAEIMSDG